MCDLQLYRVSLFIFTLVNFDNKAFDWRLLVTLGLLLLLLLLD
jgi:hypothetical protein